MRIRRQRRPALTLLETVLTFAIAMLIMLALFGIMSSQYGASESGREVVDEAQVARAILTRIASDITDTLGPVDPRFLPSAILPNNANASTTKISTATAAASAASNGNATANADATMAGSGSTSPSPFTPVPYNLGVKGDAKWLVLSTNRVPTSLLVNPKAPVIDGSIVSADLRVLSYWLADQGGLARNEMGYVTADGVPTDQPNFSDAPQYVIAGEVVDLRFRYYDGLAWQESWDGGALGGNDGNTPIGPPAAIEIKLTLKRATANTAGDATDAPTASFVHVVTLPASNAFTQANQSGVGAQASGQYLAPALQNGQPIPAANSQSSTGM